MSEQIDYYCKLCDSHMNSLQMWESHIDGKRHLKNLKKDPGETPSKQKLVPRDDLEPVLTELLKDAEGPVIGLEKIQEIRRQDYSMEATYSCYCCNGTFTKSTIVPHITSTKHRFQYLRIVDPAWYTTVQNMQMRKPHTDALAEEQAHRHEMQFGRGEVQVRVEKGYNDAMAVKRTRYVDLDRPGTSSASTSSSNLPVQGAAAAAASVPVPAAEAKGIEDFDIIRDSDMIGTKMRLAIMRSMLEDKLPVETDEDAELFVEIIKDLQRFKVLHRVRQLPPDKLDKLYKEVMSPDDKESLWQTIVNSKP